MTKLPKARRSKLVVQELADEVLIYDLERDKAHCRRGKIVHLGSRDGSRRS